jgi:glycosyltransferase involved in cell wall biosynthesis
VLAGDSYKENWLDWFKEHGKEIHYAFLHKPNPAMQFFEAIRKYTSAAIIYQCHDLHYLRLQRQAELTNDPILIDEASFFREKENYLFLNSDALLTFSCVEEEIIHKDFMDKDVYTVPLFFYDRPPKARRDFSKRVDLLYVGGFGHIPNRDAVEWFCNEVLPLLLKRLPNLTLNVVGANPPKEILALSSSNVRILGKVSDIELDNLYRSAKLSVIPLRFGAGVKGKVIEAFYHAVPLVSTSIGLEGITRVDQVAIPKDSPSDFAKEIIDLYENESLWIERSASCAKFVAENFTTHKTAEQFKKILLKAESSAKARLHLNTPSLGDNPLRAIAFYLPQYHPIPENDKWWGKGFTEWRNVCKAKPLFKGHYQPHVPADLGFYDLRLEEVRVAQADLARSYGISGFCYYHYWFNGHRLLETPAEEILKSSKPDFPFCLCWANENWTRTWDGQDSSVLIEQIYSEEDDRAHINDLFRFFHDPRYIRIDGKPLFLVYRTENMPDPVKTAEVWRQEARKTGLGELYLVRVESIGHINPLEIGFDASLEFAPDWSRMGSVARSFKSENSKNPETIELPVDVYEKNYTRSYDELMTQMLSKEQPSYPWFRCVTPSWDNSARRTDNAVILLGSSPQLYQRWLEKIVSKTIAVNQPAEHVIFINAWNEWAEGCHLEPCIKYGRSYLEATKLAIENVLPSNMSDMNKPASPPSFSAKLIGEESSEDLARSMHKLILDNNSRESLIISFEDIYESGELTYIKGWAAINDDICSVGSEVMILVHGNKNPRLITPAKRTRPEITSHFSNGRNYDFSGFEGMVKRINSDDKIFVLIKRGEDMFWQSFR